MGSFQAPNYGYGSHGGLGSGASSPLIVLFERDDSIAVPLLSELRLAGYDVRAARTPVEFFDLLSKHPASLVLVDLGLATATRREFWIALDTQRRGRSIQVMTYRNLAPGAPFDVEYDAPQPLADVDLRGPEDFTQLIAMVRQRLPLAQLPVPPLGQGAAYRPPMTPPGVAAGYGPYAPPSLPGPPVGYGAAPVAGAAYPMGAAPAAYAPGMMPLAPQAPINPGFGTVQPQGSRFANPEPQNPFAAEMVSGPRAGAQASMGQGADSPFAQPYAMNPFNAAAAGERHSAPSSALRQQLHAPTQGTPPAPAPEPVRSPGPFGFGVRDGDFSALGNPFASHSDEADEWTGTSARRAFTDSWTPPEADDADDARSNDARFVPVSSLADERAAFDGDLGPFGPPSIADQPTISRGTQRRERMPTAPIDEYGPTVPVPSTMQAPGTSSPTEAALSNVLLEGALLTEANLDVLKGVRQMLAATGKRFKLGELALLFHFLSPDQLLAALLVSRGLVSPQQIAGLGRVKQELAASGMDHDLESLVIMFNILPEEQVRQLRAELA